jgi:hypothetical protein
MQYNTITYVGKSGGCFYARVGKAVYEFEWQKGVGIGRKADEIHPDHVKKIAKWRDKRGKRLFVLE